MNIVQFIEVVLYAIFTLLPTSIVIDAMMNIFVHKSVRSMIPFLINAISIIFFLFLYFAEFLKSQNTARSLYQI